MTKRKSKANKKIRRDPKPKKIVVAGKNERPLKDWQKDLVVCLLLAIGLLILFFPLIFEDQVYKENDNLQFAIVNNGFDEYQNQTGDLAYWNPNPWGGIPNTFEIPKSKLSIDFYLSFLSELFSLPYIFYLWGAIGMFFLCRHLRFNHPLAILGSLLFVLAPYFKSLVIVGHINKLQALMHIPWVLWSALLLLKKPKLLHVLFFALTFALELRSNHYQIVFYCGFLILFLWIAHVWPYIKGQNFPALGKQIFTFSIAGILALLVAAEPLLIAFKYSNDSVRSQQVLSLQDAEGERAKGVSKKFVRTWSFHPSELLSLAVPRANGGLTDDVYHSAHFVGFKDGQVSSYWGHSGFNATYYYLGVLALLLMCFGFLRFARDATFIALFAASILMLIWSMGTFIEPFFDFCYRFIPFFKNFRTPPTSMSVVYIALPIMVLYGMRSIRDIQFKSERLKAIIPLGLFGLFGLGMLFYASQASYLKDGEDISTKMVMALQGIRKEMLLQDIYRYLVIVGVGASLILAFFYKKINFQLLIFSIAAVMVIDFIMIHERYPFKTINKQEFRRTYLDPSPTVNFLKNDPEYFRVLPFSTSNFGLPAHVQTIGGGLDLQMNVTTYEVSANCLHHKIDGKTQLNWNMLDVLNVKYVVADREVNHDYLSLEYSDPIQKLNTYRYKFDRPRGFFVDNFEVITDDRKRLERMNDRQVDLRSVALLERAPIKPIRPASRSKTEVLSFSNNKVIYNVEAVAEGLFVMSDVYTPKAQEVYIDGDLVTDVYKTNHMLQSVIVPSGFHTVEIRYKKQIYQLSSLVTSISLMLIYLVGGWLLFKKFKADKLEPAAAQV